MDRNINIIIELSWDGINMDQDLHCLFLRRMEKSRGTMFFML